MIVNVGGLGLWSKFEGEGRINKGLRDLGILDSEVVVIIEKR